MLCFIGKKSLSPSLPPVVAGGLLLCGAPCPALGLEFCFVLSIKWPVPLSPPVVGNCLLLYGASCPALGLEFCCVLFVEMACPPLSPCGWWYALLQGCFVEPLASCILSPNLGGLTNKLVEALRLHGCGALALEIQASAPERAAIILPERAITNVPIATPRASPFSRYIPPNIARTCDHDR